MLTMSIGLLKGLWATEQSRNMDMESAMWAALLGGTSTVVSVTLRSLAASIHAAAQSER